MSTSEPNGCTIREVPIIINKSHFAKSFDTSLWNFFGRFSPKNTISGLTTPGQSSQIGTVSANIFSVIVMKLLKNKL